MAPPAPVGMEPATRVLPRFVARLALHLCVCATPGRQHGYWLSSHGSSPATYYQADAKVSFTTSQDGAPMMARVNLSNPVCTGGCPPKAKVDVPPCVVDYEIKCLVPTDPTVYGFYATTVPSCLTKASDWMCKTRLTGALYQTQGHGAAFFMRAVWEPSQPGPPLHLEPFGTFETGCPADNTGSLEGRLMSVAA